MGTFTPDSKALLMNPGGMPSKVTGCLDDFTQHGDLDFDGTDYYADFPNSPTPGPFPSPFPQQRPTSGGARYSGIQFETDAPASANC